MRYLLLGEKSLITRMGEYLVEEGEEVHLIGGSLTTQNTYCWGEGVLQSPFLGDLLKNIERVLILFPEGKWEKVKFLLESPALKGKEIMLLTSYHVYGIPKFIPVTEDYFPSPVSKRGWEELFTEEMVRFFSFQKGFSYAIFRSSEVFGPKIPGVIGDLCKKGVNGEEIPLYEKNIMVDLLYIQDLLQGLKKALETFEKIKGEIINISSGKGVGIREIVKKILSLSGEKPSNFSYSSLNPPFPEIILSPVKMRLLLKWSPRYNWERGIELLFSHLQEV